MVNQNFFFKFGKDLWSKNGVKKKKKKVCRFFQKYVCGKKRIFISDLYKTSFFTKVDIFSCIVDFIKVIYLSIFLWKCWYMLIYLQKRFFQNNLKITTFYSKYLYIGTFEQKPIFQNDLKSVLNCEILIFMDTYGHKYF